MSRTGGDQSTSTGGHLAARSLREPLKRLNLLRRQLFSSLVAQSASLIQQNSTSTNTASSSPVNSQSSPSKTTSRGSRSSPSVASVINVAARNAAAAGGKQQNENTLDPKQIAAPSGVDPLGAAGHSAKARQNSPRRSCEHLLRMIVDKNSASGSDSQLDSSHVAIQQHLATDDMLILLGSSRCPPAASATGAPDLSTPEKQMERLVDLLNQISRIQEHQSQSQSQSIDDTTSEQNNPSSSSFMLDQQHLFQLTDQSWSSFIDLSLLGADLSPEEATDLRIQQDAIWELLTTEVSYIKRLKVIVDLFMNVLFGLQRHNLLVDIEPELLFSNVHQIYEANRCLYTNYLSQILSQARLTSRPLRPSAMMSAFVQIRDLFKPYYRYCLEHTACLRYLKHQSRTNELFKVYLAWCESQKDCERLRLSDLLAKPMQRLTRYSLLLKAITKRTKDPHELNQLKLMSLHVDRFVLTVDLELRRKDELERLILLSKRIDSCDIGLSSLYGLDEVELLVRNYCDNFDLLGPLFESCQFACRRQLLFDSAHVGFCDGLGGGPSGVDTNPAASAHSDAGSNANSFGASQSNNSNQHHHQPESPQNHSSTRHMQRSTSTSHLLKFKDAQTSGKMEIVLLILTDQLLVCKQVQVASCPAASSNQNKSSSGKTGANSNRSNGHSPVRSAAASYAAPPSYFDPNPSRLPNKLNGATGAGLSATRLVNALNLQAHRPRTGSHSTSLTGAGGSHHRRASSLLQGQLSPRALSLILLSNSGPQQQQQQQPQHFVARHKDTKKATSPLHSSNSSLLGAMAREMFAHSSNRSSRSAEQQHTFDLADQSAEFHHRTTTSKYSKRLKLIRSPYPIERLVVHELRDGQGVFCCQLNDSTRTIVTSFIVYTPFDITNSNKSDDYSSYDFGPHQRHSMRKSKSDSHHLSPARQLINLIRHAQARYKIAADFHGVQVSSFRAAMRKASAAVSSQQIAAAAAAHSQRSRLATWSSFRHSSAANALTTGGAKQRPATGRKQHGKQSKCGPMSSRADDHHRATFSADRRSVSSENQTGNQKSAANAVMQSLFAPASKRADPMQRAVAEQHQMMLLNHGLVDRLLSYDFKYLPMEGASDDELHLVPKAVDLFHVTTAAMGTASQSHPTGSRRHRRRLHDSETNSENGGFLGVYDLRTLATANGSQSSVFETDLGAAERLLSPSRCSRPTGITQPNQHDNQPTIGASERRKTRLQMSRPARISAPGSTNLASADLSTTSDNETTTNQAGFTSNDNSMASSCSSTRSSSPYVSNASPLSHWLSRQKRIATTSSDQQQLSALISKTDAKPQTNHTQNSVNVDSNASSGCKSPRRQNLASLRRQNVVVSVEQPTTAAAAAAAASSLRPKRSYANRRKSSSIFSTQDTQASIDLQTSLTNASRRAKFSEQHQNCCWTSGASSTLDHMSVTLDDESVAGQQESASCNDSNQAASFELGQLGSPYCLVNTQTTRSASVEVQASPISVTLTLPNHPNPNPNPYPSELHTQTSLRVPPSQQLLDIPGKQQTTRRWSASDSGARRRSRKPCLSPIESSWLSSANRSETDDYEDLYENTTAMGNLDDSRNQLIKLRRDFLSRSDESCQNRRSGVEVPILNVSSDLCCSGEHSLDDCDDQDDLDLFSAPAAGANENDKNNTNNSNRQPLADQDGYYFFADTLRPSSATERHLAAPSSNSSLELSLNDDGGGGRGGGGGARATSNNGDIANNNNIDPGSSKPSSPSKFLKKLIYFGSRRISPNDESLAPSADAKTQRTEAQRSSMSQLCHESASNSENITRLRVALSDAEEISDQDIDSRLIDVNCIDLLLRERNSDTTVPTQNGSNQTTTASGGMAASGQDHQTSASAANNKSKTCYLGFHEKIALHHELQQQQQQQQKRQRSHINSAQDDNNKRSAFSRNILTSRSHRALHLTRSMTTELLSSLLRVATLQSTKSSTDRKSNNNIY